VQLSGPHRRKPAVLDGFLAPEDHPALALQASADYGKSAPNLEYTLAGWSIAEADGL
jgi:hypothetical protein